MAELQKFSTEMWWDGYKFTFKDHDLFVNVVIHHSDTFRTTNLFGPIAANEQGEIDLSGAFECYQKTKAENPNSKVTIKIPGFHIPIKFDKDILNHPVREETINRMLEKIPKSILNQGPRKTLRLERISDKEIADAERLDKLALAEEENILE